MVYSHLPYDSQRQGNDVLPKNINRTYLLNDLNSNSFTFIPSQPSKMFGFWRQLDSSHSFLLTQINNFFLNQTESSQVQFIALLLDGVEQLGSRFTLMIPWWTGNWGSTSVFIKERKLKLLHLPGKEGWLSQQQESHKLLVIPILRLYPWHWAWYNASVWQPSFSFLMKLLELLFHFSELRS